MTTQEDLAVIEPPSLSTSKASSPFDRGDADLVLRTSDRVDFLVHRPILAIASPFFESMLSLPQPPADHDQGLDKPIIDISEDARTTEAFLRFIYPTLDPEVKELPLLRSVLAAGVKYESSVVIAAMKRTMVSTRFLHTKPLSIFAMACRYQFEHEARAAAGRVKEYSSGQQTHNDSVLDELNAGQYFRLLQFKRETTLSIFFDFCRPPSVLLQAPSEVVDAAIDVTFPFTGPSGDLILKSCDSRSFYVHRTIIALASPGMLDDILKMDTMDAGAMPIYPMKENSICVNILLRLCYPTTKPEFPSAPIYHAVLVAARRYQLREVERVARTHWKTFVTQDVVMNFYFLAVELGWKEEAVACARQLALPVLVLEAYPRLKPKPSKKKHLTGASCPTAYIRYTPSMESFSSIPYRNLLSYVDGYRKAAASTLRLSDLPVQPSMVQSSSLKSGLSEYLTTRYPTEISTDAPPPWLEDQFTSIKLALARRPSSDVLALDTPLWCSFIAFVANDKGSGEHYINPTSKVQWASKVLQRYAEAIDQATLHVELKM